MEERKMSHHLHKRGLQDEWCKEPPLEMSPTQDKTQSESSQVSQNHSCRVSLLSQNSMSLNMEEGTLYIRRSDLEGKMSES